MEIVGVEHLTFHYPEEKAPALVDVSLSVRQGEFVVLCGSSGCGKTTLLRHLKPELAPHGRRTGKVRYLGRPLESLEPREAASRIGMVFQNPHNQIVTDTVWHELAFAMENIGLPLQVMRSRLAEMAHFFGLEPLLYESVHKLSGGQLQMINLASVLLLQPEVLLLDEPTSQLDPVAAREFLHMLHRLSRELSMTVILSEHRLEDVLPIADRVVMLESGRILHTGKPAEFAARIGLSGHQETLGYLPSVTRLYYAAAKADAFDAADAPPLSVREGKQWLTARLGQRTGAPGISGNGINTARAQTSGATQSDRAAAAVGNTAAPLLSCREVTFRYERDTPDVLRKLSLDIRTGEFLAIVGGNGSGKSTLLQLMAGLLKPQRGSVRSGRLDQAAARAVRDRSSGSGIRIGYLAQNPMLYFSHDTVREELMHMAKLAGLTPDQTYEELARLLSLMPIGDKLDNHPHDLSGGQQQLAALAIVLIGRPELLLIDEPTKGLDPEAKRRMGELLQELRSHGTTVAMVTHDIEFAARHATRCALLFDGSITADNEPHAFFGDNYFYTTAINRAVRDWLPDALTCEDVLQAWPEPAELRS